MSTPQLPDLQAAARRRRPRHASGFSTGQWLALIATAVVVVAVVAVIAITAVTDPSNRTRTDAADRGGPGPTTSTNSGVAGGSDQAAALATQTVVVAGGNGGGGTVSVGGNGNGGHVGGSTPTAPGSVTGTHTGTATGSATTSHSNTTTTATGTHIVIKPSNIRASAILSVLDPPPARLLPSTPPAYGAADLSSGFSADPYSVGVAAGGPVNVNYLGGSCRGFSSAAPSLKINYGGSGSLLRLYFVGANGDPAMVVYDPYGNFYCVDDSFGTVNPTIDFNNPAVGSYEIWIASYASNATLSGTFYVTGNSGNHP
ncbi:MAG: hypothetical protein JO147_04995 [Actinobacteria bacterium]|nr:hypothetical protein [Actinomycetota bacterium]